jgi:hypothetical protein
MLRAKELKEGLAFTLPMSRESLANKRSSLWFWIALPAIVLLLTFLLYSPLFKNFVDKANDWARVIMNAHPVIGAAVFFLFAATSAMLAFTSSVVLVPPANLVWENSLLPPVSVIAFVTSRLSGRVSRFRLSRIPRPSPFSSPVASTLAYRTAPPNTRLA